MHQSKLIGSSRTYVYTGSQGLTMNAWFDGVKKGHAFVSFGPLVELTVNGMLPGDDVRLENPGSVEVVGRVRSITPLTIVTLIANGQVIEKIPLSADRRSADFRKSIPVAASSWMHLRAEGDPADRFPLDADYAQAFTNPVWITVGGRPVRNREAADYGIRWIDELQKLADAWPGWRSQREKDHVFGQFEEARQIYRQRGSEATR
jgi:hypothetical protein